MSIKDYPWLSQALEKLPQALPDALLIHGQAGTGKHILARMLAQNLLCTNSAGLGQPCGQCSGCHLFEVGNHPDYRLIQPETEAEEGGRGAARRAAKGKKPSSQIPVAEIRSLVDLVTKVSHLGGAKVVVIAPADALRQHAGNALLKMLEEPNRDTYFILVTNEAHRILPTISSRCFKLAVSAPSLNQATAWLNDRTSEHVDAALRLSSFGPLAALELSANSEFWSCRETLLGEFDESTPDPLRLAAGAERLEPDAVGRLLETWVYDLLATQKGADIRYHADKQAIIKRTAQRVAGSELCHWSDAVREYLRAASHPLNRRIALEALFAKWPGSQAV